MLFPDPFDSDFELIGLKPPLLFPMINEAPRIEKSIEKQGVPPNRSNFVLRTFVLLAPRVVSGRRLGSGSIYTTSGHRAWGIKYTFSV